MWIPENARRVLVDERHRHNAEVMRRLEAEADVRKMREWTAALREIDPYLELVKAKDNADGIAGMKPGYWHVLRHNPGAPAHLMVIETDEGYFKEPDSSVFQMLRESDCWSDELRRDRRHKQERARQAEESRKERERQERNEEALQRLKALENPSVLFGDRPWTYRTGVRRG